mmetsp:Transcript_53349/g.173474  ORF Transcript_53349/g.173474 Transcript_53349/m.173474 type:complete len:1193 (+) Transcript_53349:290-3868(+)
MQGCRSLALVVRGPGLDGGFLHGHPADGTVAKSLHLYSGLCSIGLLLGSLQDLHSLALRQHADLLAGLRSDELLRQRHILQNAEVLGAGLRVDSACVALSGDPANSVVLDALALDARDPGIRDLCGALLDGEELTDGQLADNLAILDVKVVCHSHRGRARVVLAVSLAKNKAGLVPGREPAHRAIQDRFALDAQARLIGLFSGALDEFQHLVGLQAAHEAGAALALEVLLQGHVFLDPVKGLLDFLQERSALVALETDPALLAICQGLAPDAHDGGLRIGLRPFQKLDNLLKLGFSDRLRHGDVESIGDGDALNDREVLLHEGLESSSADAAGLDVPAEQPDLLGLEGGARQGLDILAEGILGDLLVARRCHLAEERLQRQALLESLLPEHARDLAAPRADDDLALLVHGVQRSEALLLGGLALGVHLLKLSSGIEHRTPNVAGRKLALLLLDDRLGLLDALEHCLQFLLAGLHNGERSGEGIELFSSDILECLSSLIKGLGPRLQGLELGSGRRRDDLGLFALTPLDVRVLLGDLILGIILLAVAQLDLQLAQRVLAGLGLGPELPELRAGLREGPVPASGHEFLDLAGEPGSDLGEGLGGLLEGLVHAMAKVRVGRDRFHELRALVAMHGDEARFVRHHSSALDPRQAVRVVGLLVVLRDKLAAGLDLSDGLALADLEDIRDRDFLNADEALHEHALELGERDVAVTVGVDAAEHGRAALRCELDVFPAKGRRQLLEVSRESILRQALSAPSELLVYGLVGCLLGFHVVPQSRGQQANAHADQELESTLLDQRCAGVCSLLELCIHAFEFLRRLRKHLFRHVLRLMSARHLLVLGHLSLGLLEFALQLLQGCEMARVGSRIPLPRPQEVAGVAQRSHALLHLFHELLTFGLAALGAGTLLGGGERLGELRHLLHGSLRRRHLLTGLLHERGLLAALGVLLKCPELCGGGVDALGELGELVGGGFRSRLTELADLEVLRGDEGARTVHGRLHRLRGRLRVRDRGLRLREGDDLDTLQERQLNLVDLLQAGVHLGNLFLALAHKGIAHHPLALVLRDRHELGDLGLSSLASLHEFLKQSLERGRRAGGVGLDDPHGALQGRRAHAEGLGHDLDVLVRDLGLLDAQGCLLLARFHLFLRDGELLLNLLDLLVLLHQYLFALDHLLARRCRFLSLHQLLLCGVDSGLKLGQCLL